MNISEIENTEYIVRTAVAPLLDSPRISSAPRSQLLAGWTVRSREVAGDWCAVTTADGYEGWTHIGYLAAAPASSARRTREGTLVSLGCTTRDASGATRALPFGAFLSPGERATDGEAIDAATRSRRFPARADAIAATARAYFAGSSYVWGGITPWGADCSGLVQSAFAMHGHSLPRDAWQQAEAGSEIAGGIVNAIPGDLLFFSDRDDRRVTHVGVGLGDSRMIHMGLGRGGYSEESFAQSTDEYTKALAGRFTGARRVLGA